jgi:hypothetical protein
MGPIGGAILMSDEEKYIVTAQEITYWRVFFFPRPCRFR